ncbi:replication/maintenance protein RepL [Streptomyces sp. NPDC057011]|uniref:replication/maintenance protein RepL n=1 Tax=unclassified Streptomyces TaxID=2593676 RepID=UPI003642466B
MPRNAPRVRRLNAVNETTGEITNFNVVADGEPFYSYGFVSKQYAMLDFSFWRIAEEHNFTGFDYRLYGFFYERQSRKDPGRVIIKSQRWIAEQMGTKQANVSASLKKLRTSRLLYSESRTVWYLNPQIAYCGNGKTHGDAIQAMPDGSFIYVTPDKSAA